MRNIYIVVACVLILASCSAPRAAFNTIEKTIQIGDELSFENSSKNSESYVWDFGDGNSSEELSPTHIYWSSGRYEVSLKAINSDKEVIKTREIVVEPTEKCLVLLKTSLGNMVLELFDSTPSHRDNFNKLVEEGYYNDLLFHRVIPSFMIQGGDPESKFAKADKSLGRGGPGYTVPAEISEEHIHVKGAIAAARTPDVVNPEKASSGSQFYIVHGKSLDRTHLERMMQSRGIKYTEEQITDYLKYGGTPHLDGEYTVYGRVIYGLDVIDKIAAVKRNNRDRPSEDIKMSASIIK